MIIDKNFNYYIVHYIYIYIYNITNFSLKKGRGGSMVVNADASEK